MVLRVTAPYHARMRARLHRRAADGARAPSPKVDSVAVTDRGGNDNQRPDGEDPERAGGTVAPTGAAGGTGTPIPRPAAIDLDPRTLLDEDRLPPYPEPDDSADALAGNSENSPPVERVRDRHVEAVRRWRTAATSAVVETVTIPTAAGPHRVRVAVLSLE